MENKTQSISDSQTKVLSKTLAELIERLSDLNRSMIIVFEGLDASGKSGCAERIVRYMDPKLYSLNHTVAPTKAESSYHYMKRFWSLIPPVGKLAVFDRSWYGRVLVERIDNFCSENEWKRAYEEICSFEKMLSDNGTLILKFWLDVSENIQLERFKARAENPEKQYKITPDDWQNRAKRDLYITASRDMFDNTDTDYAPWYIINGDDKKASRRDVMNKIIETLCEANPYL